MVTMAKKGWGFDSYFKGRIPPALRDEARKVELLTRLRANDADKEARDELILGHIGRAAQIVGTYIAGMRSRRLEEELMSSAVEAIIDGISEIIVADHDNVTGLVTKVIHCRLSQVLTDQPLIAVRGSAQRMRKLRGKDRIEGPKIHDVSRSVIHARVTSQAEDVVDEAIFNETMQLVREKVCINDQEQEVLDLRLDGLSDREIGEKLGLDRRVIWAIRRGMQDRYAEVCK